MDGAAAIGDDSQQLAFARYVLPELEVVARVARSLVRDKAEAEDLVQDTLLRAFRSIDGFDGRYPRAWLLTIMRNTHINRTRRRRPDLYDDPDRAMAELADLAAPGATDPGEIVAGDAFDSVVEVAFSKLPERYRRVVALVDLDGLSYKETAAALGLPIGTVMSQLHRARSRIRRDLSDAGLAPKGAKK